MCLRESIVVICEELNYLEFLQASATSQALEALNRDLTAPRHELYKFGTLAVIKFFQGFEEPAHYRGICAVILIHSVLLEVHDYRLLRMVELTVDVGQATDQEFKLTVIENLDELLRHDLIEPLKEVVDLLLYGVIQLVKSHLLDIVVFILICHIYVLPTRHYLDFFGLSEVFHSFREDEAEALY